IKSPRPVRGVALWRCWSRQVKYVNEPVICVPNSGEAGGCGLRIRLTTWYGQWRSRRLGLVYRQVDANNRTTAAWITWISRQSQPRKYTDERRRRAREEDRGRTPVRGGRQGHGQRELYRRSGS